MKRNFNKALLMVAMVTGIFLLGSCLKNNKYYVDFSKYAPSVELPLSATNTNKPFPVALNVTGEPVEYYVYVNVASVNKPTSPVTITLAIDSAYLDQYNAQQDAATQAAQAAYLAADSTHTVRDANYPDDYEPYVLFPASLYSVDKMTLTVPAGQREVFATLKVNTWQMDFGAKYCLPFTIVSASPSSYNISSWKHLMINLQAKNRYDGIYDVTGTMVDITTPAFKGYYPKTVSLVTQGPSTDAYFDGALNGFGYVFNTGSAISYFGNWDPVFTFDDNGNVTSVTNLYNDPAPRSRQAQLDPAGVNKFDPSTKTLEVSYFMLQAGSVRLKITETFKYKGPRG